MFEQLKEPQLINTGDRDNPTPVSEAILNGYAPGSELYTYADYPEITHDELAEMQDASYSTIFYQVTKKLLREAIPDDVLQSIAIDSYAPENFDFDDGNLRLTTLPSGIHIVGLSDGPTGSFKDMPMQPVARLMSYLQEQTGNPLTILLSTSGDTGPAALKAFAGLNEIIAMLPKKGVSQFQWAQMAEMASRSDVHVLEVEGSFSDLNDFQLEADAKYDLGAANSVNIARLIAQIPYSVASYLQAIKLEGRQVGEPVDVSVPSGNFGNALSVIIARHMGVPIRNIIVATNENDTLYHMIHNREFREAEFKHTDSSAQDVRMPSNAWRYLSLIYGNDPDKVALIWQTLERFKNVKLDDIGFTDDNITQGILTARITAKERAQVIQQTYADSKQSIIVDPHTANGLAAIDQLAARESDIPMLSMETAKPFKFNEAMMRILGIVPPRPARFKNLEDRQANTELTQIANLKGLLAYLENHTQVRHKNA